MSVCVNHMRRRVVGSSISVRRSAPLTSLSSFDSLPIRHFAAAAERKSNKKGGDEANGLSYKARKEAAKQKRIDAYNAKQSRLERLKTRRDSSPKDVKKNKFRSWWDKEMVYHDCIRRDAKKAGKPWKIRVAAVVERLPVVTPDVEQWEREFLDLRDYLWTYGKMYPDETGFMYAPDKPEDHIVPTDEELLAGLPFEVPPRETEADKMGNVRTRDRQLKERVYLTVRSGNEGALSGPRWTLPSVIPRSDEMLLDAAQRAVAESVGGDLVLWCPSNAPMNVNFRVYNKNLPEEFRQNYYGEKIFYYRVQYDHGDIDEDVVTKNGEDFAWLTRGEVVEKITEERGGHQAVFFHYML